VITLALLGAGLTLATLVRADRGEIGAEMRRPRDELTQKATGRIEKDLGALDSTGERPYRPAKPD
jgi:hypothetical protein